jgi:hypothetical protein
MNMDGLASDLLWHFGLGMLLGVVGNLSYPGLSFVVRIFNGIDSWSVVVNYR